MAVRDLEKYLVDLENRIDAAEEKRISAEWLKFLKGCSNDNVFMPERQPVPPRPLEWPTINTNDAILDLLSYEMMLLGQLAERFKIEKVGARELFHLTESLYRELLAHTICCLMNFKRSNPTRQFELMFEQ